MGVLVMAQLVRLGGRKGVHPVVVVVDIVVVVWGRKEGRKGGREGMRLWVHFPFALPSSLPLPPFPPHTRTGKYVEAVAPFVALPNMDFVGL